MRLASHGPNHDLTYHCNSGSVTVLMKRSATRGMGLPERRLGVTSRRDLGEIAILGIGFFLLSHGLACCPNMFSSSLNRARCRAHQGGYCHAMTRFLVLEGFFEGSLSL